MSDTLEGFIPRSQSVPPQIIDLIRYNPGFTYRDIRKIVGTHYRRPTFYGRGFIYAVNRILDEKVIPGLTEAEIVRLRKAKSTYEADLRDQVKYDLLTGVLTRRYTENELPKFIKKYPRSKIIFLDGDNFKSCNDDFSHEKGDQTLQALGGILNDTLSDFGLVGRWGGEEFIAVIPDEVKDLDNRIGEIRSGFLQYYNGDAEFARTESEFKGTLSFGVYQANFRNPIEILREALDRADRALHVAKGDYTVSGISPHGRDRVMIWRPEFDKATPAPKSI